MLLLLMVLSMKGFLVRPMNFVNDVEADLTNAALKIMLNSDLIFIEPTESTIDDKLQSNTDYRNAVFSKCFEPGALLVIQELEVKGISQNSDDFDEFAAIAIYEQGAKLYNLFFEDELISKAKSVLKDLIDERESRVISKPYFANSSFEQDAVLEHLFDNGLIVTINQPL